MGFIFANPNPDELFNGDCVIRALSIALNKPWDDIYLDLCTLGFIMKDMQNADAVWGKYLIENGFKRYILNNECDTCYHLRDFCDDFPEGTYVIATGTHAVAVIDGDYYDTADSGDCIPIYYYRKEV